MNFAEIDENIIDPQTDEVLKKNVFIIFAHGKQLVAKLRKAAESLGATIYPVDERPDKRRFKLINIKFNHVEKMHWKLFLDWKI